MLLKRLYRYPFPSKRLDREACVRGSPIESSNPFENPIHLFLEAMRSIAGVPIRKNRFRGIKRDPDFAKLSDFGGVPSPSVGPCHGSRRQPSLTPVSGSSDAESGELSKCRNAELLSCDHDKAIFFVTAGSQ